MENEEQELVLPSREELMKDIQDARERRYNREVQDSVEYIKKDITREILKLIENAEEGKITPKDGEPLYTKEWNRTGGLLWHLREEDTQRVADSLKAQIELKGYAFDACVKPECLYIQVF